MSSLGNTSSSILPSLGQDIGYFVVSFVNAFYFLDISPLSAVLSVNIIFHAVGHLCTLAQTSFNITFFKLKKQSSKKQLGPLQ